MENQQPHLARNFSRSFVMDMGSPVFFVNDAFEAQATPKLLKNCVYFATSHRFVGIFK